ncbi:hypothetical protein H257_17166 [Aphanomyces astaci]|uniref:Uncharacterized protein n=1 Tax=Aphanomyces astaci TaxID=112090 RepID=W4FG11_APHAT|nr:hypothetical protein H257_17166 [Aphanomyces astaci]ETV66380.1 hypothetical protein H257_17166 [Aphanomyces astaci]|eukprot:XP_009844155.1 hypothetical protein H257_17166 [Aphanomyces astaci]
MRYLIVATAIAAAAAQTTNVESTYVEQVLNARGGGAIKYAGGNLNIDSLLQSYPECQSCSVSTPCAHRNLLGTGTCIGSSSRQVDGVKTSYCLDFDVCCGGNCRNSRRPTKKCSFQGNEIKTSLGNANFNSARSMLAYIQVDLLDTIPIAQVSNLITSVADESTLSARCSSSCNGWSWQGQLLSGSCPSSCACDLLPLPTFVAGNLFECELKVPNADSFFSSGDKKLTQDANLGAIQGKVVCPKGYTCSKPDTCVSYETFETVKASTVVPTVAPAIINAPSGAATSSNSKSGSVVAIAVGASVVGLLAIGGAVFCFMRKKKSTDDDYHAMSEGTL